MRASPVLTCFWPGLPQLWLRGQWFGLIAALGFAVMLNFALLATFVWPELSRTMLPALGWLVVGVVWISSTWFSLRIRSLENAASEADGGVDLYPQAQSEYLRGHWFEAETLLQTLLRRNDHDLEAHLLLVTMYRHTNRLAEATKQLDLLQSLGGWQKWQMEVLRERELLEEEKLSEEAQASGESKLGESQHDGQRDNANGGEAA
ncbi:MAG: hypothetical protein ACI9HK_004667 [Pirellulaceae bacterium]|jgi:hypothetical protein